MNRDLIKNLNQNATVSIRLTHNIDDVVEVLKMTSIINGKAIDEAIEYSYLPNKTKVYESIATKTNYSVRAIEDAHKSYTVELALRIEINRREKEKIKIIEDKQREQRRINADIADKRRKEIADKKANEEAEKETEKVTKFRDSQNEKLSSLSEGAKRELGKGITTNGGKPNPKGIAIALKTLEVIPTKATAKEVKEVREPREPIIVKPTYAELEATIVKLELELKKEKSLKERRNKQIKLLKSRVDLTPLNEAIEKLNDYWDLYQKSLRNWADRVRKAHEAKFEAKFAHIENDLNGLNPFIALGLTNNATLDEVKAKYKNLAKLYHPDKPDGDETKFKEVAKAYHTIRKGLNNAK